MQPSRFLAKQGAVLRALSDADVGTWEWDVASDRAFVSDVTARLYGFTAEVLRRGPSLRDFLDAVHPDDLGELNRTVEAVRLRAKGGLFIAEFRVIPNKTHRWILCRGHFFADGNGVVTHGRGVVIDVTRSREHGFGEGRALFAAPLDPPTDALGQLVDNALEGWSLMEELPPEDRRDIEPSLRLLMTTLARRVAKSMSLNDLRALRRFHS